VTADVHRLVDSLARDSASRLVAALARRLGAGRIAVAEDAVQHALMQALTHWPFKGVPAKPAAWLAAVARNRAFDLLRGEVRPLAFAEDLALFAAPRREFAGLFDRELNDDELALLFAVCHPVLSPDLRVTFALKTVCGLAVPQIAAGLLSEPATIAQRLVRARRQFAQAEVSIETPPPEALAERAESVRTSIYLMFNEGYSASSGDDLVHPELCIEAVRLARALAAHPVTASAASDALAALLALTAARLTTRVGPDGVAQLLDDQPRSQWDRQLIGIGIDHLGRSGRGEEITVWHLRAEIASLHATAAATAETNWGAHRGDLRRAAPARPLAGRRAGARCRRRQGTGCSGSACAAAGPRRRSLCACCAGRLLP
jgi:RNA polymerase sigma-70 factor (ECF subfamily)